MKVVSVHCKTVVTVQVAGYTSSKDGCQTIIADLARDILNQREHRSVK